MVKRITEKNRVVATLLVVHAREELMLVFVVEITEVDSATRVACFGEPGSDFCRRGREQGRIDLVVDERISSPESGRASHHGDPTTCSSALLTRDPAEVTPQHLRVGNKHETLRRRRTFEGPLITAEKE